MNQLTLDEALEIFQGAQKLIEEALKDINAQPNADVLEGLHRELPGLITLQIKIEAKLFEDFEQIPEYTYHCVTLKEYVKIINGEAGADPKKKCKKRYSFTEQKSICAECALAERPYKIFEVPHGFTTKTFDMGAGIQIHRYQCSCGQWDGGYVLDRVVNAGL